MPIQNYPQLFLAIILALQTNFILGDLRLRLHPLDVFSLNPAHIFPFGTRTSEIGILKDSSLVDASLTDILAKNNGPALKELPQEFKGKLRNALDIANNGEYIAALVKEKEGGCSALLMKTEGNVFSSPDDIFALPLAEFDFACKQIALDESFVYFTAISYGRVYLCARPVFQMELKGTCSMLGGNYAITEEAAQTLEVKMEFLASPGRKKGVFLVYLPRSQVEFFERRLAFVFEEKIEYQEIPIEGFVIEKLALLNYRQEEGRVDVLALGLRENESELFSLAFRNGVLDREELKGGLLKIQIENFDFCAGKIVSSKLNDNEGEKSVEISFLSAETLTETKINFPGSIALVKAKSVGQTKIALELLETSGQKKMHIVELASGLIWDLSEDLLEGDFKWVSISESNQVNSQALIFVKMAEESLLNLGLNSEVELKISFKNPSGAKQGKTSVQINRKNKQLAKFSLESTSFDELDLNLTIGLFGFNDEAGKIRLPVFGNGLEYKSSKIKFANQLEIQNEDQIFSKCKVLRFASKNSFLAFLCAEEKILVGSVLNTQNSESNALQIDFAEFELIWHKSKDVVDFGFVNEELVVLTDKLELNIISPYRLEKTGKPDRSQSRYSELKDMQEMCWIAENAILCKKRKTITVFSLVLNGGKCDLLSQAIVPSEGVSTKSVGLCSATQGQIIFVKQNKGKNRAENSFDAYKQYQRKTVNLSERLPEEIQGEPRIFEIGPESFLLSFEDKGVLKLLGLKQNSLINFPTKEFLRSFKDLVAIKAILEEELFAVFYQTIEGLHRVAVYKNTLNPIQRLLAEFELSEINCEGEFSGIGKIAPNLVQIYFGCQAQGEKTESLFKAWSLSADGPFLELSALTTSQAITINQSTHKFQFELPPEKEGLSIKAEDFYLGARLNTKGLLEKRLESEKVLEISGPVRQIALKANLPGLKFVERAALVKEHLFIDNLDKAHAKAPAFISLQKDGYSVEFGEFTLVDSKTEISNSQRNCRPVKIAANESALAHFFVAPNFCEGTKSSNFIVKLSNKQAILLPEESLSPLIEFEESFLVNTSKGSFLFFRSLKGASLVILKLGFDKAAEKWAVDFYRTLYLYSAFPSLITVSSFFVFYDNKNEEIWAVLNSSFDTKFLFARINFYTLNFELQTAQEINFAIQNKSYRIASSEFFVEKDTLSAFVFSEIGIFVLQFSKKEAWSFKITENYALFLHRPDQRQIIRHNQNYLAVLNKSSKTNSAEEILIFKRAVSDKIQQVFYVVGSEALADSSNYSILDFSLKLNETDKTSTLIIVYKAFKNQQESGKSAQLLVKEFQIGEFRLLAKPGAIEEKESLGLLIKNMDNYLVEHSILVSSSGIYQTTVYSLSLVCLLLLLVALLFAAKSVYGQNKALRSQFDVVARGQNPSIMVDLRDTRMNI